MAYRDFAVNLDFQVPRNLDHLDSFDLALLPWHNDRPSSSTLREARDIWLQRRERSHAKEGRYRKIDAEQRDRLHTINLDFSVEDLAALTAEQLLVVQFHPSADESDLNHAADVFLRNRHYAMLQAPDLSTSKSRDSHGNSPWPDLLSFDQDQVAQIKGPPRIVVPQSKLEPNERVDKPRLANAGAAVTTRATLMENQTLLSTTKS